MNFGALGQGLLGIAGFGFVLAIISVIVSKNSATPALINSLASAEAKIIAAAVNPASALTNGNNGLNTFTTPTIH
jgi:hypothetical protein